jgi:hypothetical protein
MFLEGCNHTILKWSKHVQLLSNSPTIANRFERYENNYLKCGIFSRGMDVYMIQILIVDITW